MPATIRFGTRYCLTAFGLVATLALSVAATANQPAVLPARDSITAARQFAADIERFLEALPLQREHLEVRINRCQTSQGKMRDEVYAVWIGARLIAPGDDADTVLDQLRAKWVDGGWELTRDRRLDNGGFNIAAVEPGTGRRYSLDSGFKVGPRRYIAGFFTTPCFVDPSGAAPFGAVRDE